MRPLESGAGVEKAHQEGTVLDRQIEMQVPRAGRVVDVLFELGFERGNAGAGEALEAEWSRRGHVRQPADERDAGRAFPDSFGAPDPRAPGLQPELADSVAKRHAGDAEPSGGLRHVAAGLVQRTRNEPALGLLEREAVQNVLGIGRGHRGHGRETERVRVEPAVAAEQDRALDGVRELPHVSRPVVAARGLQKLGRQHRGRHAVAPCGQRREVLEQRREILEALAQRRDVQREHLQPEVEVGAELAPGHHFVQVPVGGGDEPRGDAPGPGAPDAPHLAALQHRKQPRLEIERQLPYLVQVDGAVLGRLDQPRPRRVGVGERTLFVPEKLRLDQILRQRRAVEMHERAPVPDAPAVQRTGGEILPGSGLALNQHRRRESVSPAGELLDARDLRNEHPHRVAASHQRGVARGPLLALARVREPPGQLRLSQNALDLDHQLVEIDGLGQVVVGTFLHRRDRILQPAEGGQHQHRKVGVVAAPQLAQEVETGPVGQPHVEQHEIGPPGGEPVPRPRDVVRQLALHAAAPELLDDRAGEQLLVVDDEDGRSRASRLARRARLRHRHPPAIGRRPPGRRTAGTR